MMEIGNLKHGIRAWTNISLSTYDQGQPTGVTSLLSLPRLVIGPSMLLALLALHSVRAEQVELLVNGSFTNGVQGWRVWGVVSCGVSAELYAKPRMPCGIAQTVERSDFSRDISFSYRVTTVFHSSAGYPFLEISVTAYMLDPRTMNERPVLLFSRRYCSDVEVKTVRKSYDITANLRENLCQEGRLDLTSFLLKRIKVVFEAGFEDIHALMQSQIYIYNVRLLMVKSPPPPAIKTTQTAMTTTVGMMTVVIYWATALMMISALVGVAAFLLISLASKRRRGSKWKSSTN